MIRSSSQFVHAAARKRPQTWRIITIFCQPNSTLAQHQEHLLSGHRITRPSSSATAVAAPPSNDAITNSKSTINDDNNNNNNKQQPQPHAKSFVSFFDQVNEQMKRDSPEQYNRFLSSAKASSFLREMKLSSRNNNNNDGGVGGGGLVGSTTKWSEESKSVGRSSALGSYSRMNNEFSRPDAQLFTGEDDNRQHNKSDNDASTTPPTPTTPLLNNIFNSPKDASSSSSSSSALLSNNKNNDNKSGKLSIFSTISKSTNSLNINDPNNNTSTSVLLSELFPTLHNSNNINKDNSTASTTTAVTSINNNNNNNNNNQLSSYHPHHFESYHQAMTAVLSDSKMERTLSKFDSKHEGISQKVKDWLLSEHRIVEVEVVKERWTSLEDAWKDGWMVGGEHFSTGGVVCDGGTIGNEHENETETNEPADGGSSAEGGVGSIKESTFVSELKKQQKVFEALLLSNKISVDALSQTNEPPEEHDSTTPQQQQQQQQQQQLTPEFYQLAQLMIASLSRYCARRARSSPMEVAWYKVKESGMVLPRDTISTFLYVVSTMGMSDSLGLGLSRFGSGNGDRSSTQSSFFSFSDGGTSGGNTDKMVLYGDNKENNGEDEKQAQNDAFAIPEEVATYHDLLSRPTESSISLRVKALASKGDAKGAEELLESFKNSIQSDDDSKELIRLRTYLPILKQYCETNNVSAALSLFRRMQTTSGVILEPENYVLLIATLAENGFFRDDSPPIEGAQSLGYNNANGPELFDELASEMAAEALEITSASARRLYNALAIGFKSENDTNEANSIVSNLKEVHPLASMPLTSQAAERNELVASRVLLDRSTGICPVTEAHQRLILLESDQRKQLHDDLLVLAKEQYANFLGKKKEDAAEKATQELKKFADWLDTREGEPFTAIVDGANVAYYMQSFDKGRFNFHQIKFMVDTLEAIGENPLVVIPHKYAFNEFYSSKREHQKLDPVERKILKDLANNGKLYKVPPRCLDDYYWMLASVSDQTNSRKGCDLSVLTTDTKERWPGTRPALISNDQMRDHKYGLLEPRLFRRWYGCHMVNYNFTAFVNGECVNGNEIGFSQADFFSREIQANQCPINVNVEQNESQESEWGGHAWHFPVNDWDLDERFVVRIPKHISKNR